ncbi:hypothetical protein HGRIS_009631 [Hohenbuehelia grisea]|uniref:CBM1 domain-containing protein n=1 Tax=Hohenbuehelia grisea TaxID=104357 RepID=A0ABR3J1R4_9AGAR
MKATSVIALLALSAAAIAKPLSPITTTLSSSSPIKTLPPTTFPSSESDAGTTTCITWGFPGETDSETISPSSTWDGGTQTDPVPTPPSPPITPTWLSPSSTWDGGTQTDPVPTPSGPPITPTLPPTITFTSTHPHYSSPTSDPNRLCWFTRTALTQYPVPSPVPSGPQHEGAQCGGIGWNGPQTCVAGTSCTELDPYLHRCLSIYTVYPVTTVTTTHCYP